MTDELFDGDEPGRTTTTKAKTASAGFVEPLGLVLAQQPPSANRATRMWVRIEELSGRLDAPGSGGRRPARRQRPGRDLDLPDPTATTVDETLPSDEQGGGHLLRQGGQKPTL